MVQLDLQIQLHHFPGTLAASYWARHSCTFDFQGTTVCKEICTISPNCIFWWFNQFLRVSTILDGAET
eukprot:278303-Rhodomonas_salina.1